MDIIDMPIGQIKPYAKNPRKNEKAVPEVVKSIREFGFRQSLVVDAHNVLIVGHTRLLAAKELGLATVPVHIASNLTAAQVRAYRIADNRSHDRSEWDFATLLPELEEIFQENNNFDLDFFSFETKDFDSVVGFVPDLSSADEKEEKEKSIKLIVECKDMDELDELFTELNDRGYKVKL